MPPASAARRAVAAPSVPLTSAAPGRRCRRDPQNAITTIAVARSRDRPGGVGAARLRSEDVLRRLTRLNHFALVDPNLDADHAIGRVSLAESVIDICAQGMQRQLALQIPFAARDFGAVQTPRYANLDALATEAQRRIDALRIARRNATRFSSCSPIDSDTS